MKLHDTIKNIYLKCLKPLFNIEVLGENNTWKSITSLNITDKQQFFQIQTDSHSLLCTKNHIIIDEDYNEIFAYKSLGKFIITETGIEKVISVKKLILLIMHMI